MDFIQELLMTAALSVLLAFLLSGLFSTEPSVGDSHAGATDCGVGEGAAWTGEKREQGDEKTGEDRARLNEAKLEEEGEEKGSRKPEEARSHEFDVGEESKEDERPAEPPSDDHERLVPERLVLDADEGNDTAFESHVQLHEAKEEEEEEKVIRLDEEEEEENILRNAKEGRTAEFEAEKESEGEEGSIRGKVREGENFTSRMLEKVGLGIVSEFLEKEDSLEEEEEEAEEEEERKGEAKIDVVTLGLEEYTLKRMLENIEVERIDTPLLRREEEERPEEVLCSDLEEEEEKEEEQIDEVSDFRLEEGPLREMAVDINILSNDADLMRKEERSEEAITSELDLEENKEMKRFQPNEALLEKAFVIEKPEEMETSRADDKLAKDEERLAGGVLGAEMIAQPPGALAQKEGLKGVTGVQEKSGIDGTEGSFLEEEDEWEGIDRSGVEMLFSVANTYIGSGNGSDALSRLSTDVQMQLYGLHKVATEGPCYEPQPMAWKVSARAKWHAWQRLGNMNPEVAMERYMNLLSQNIPGWMGEKSRGDIKMLDGDDCLKAELLGAGLPVLCSPLVNQLSPETSWRSKVPSLDEGDDATTDMKNIEQGLTKLDSF